MIKFKYTKKNGEISNRTGVILSSPSKHYGILDLSELDVDEQKTFIDIYEQFLEEKTLLEEKYGIKQYIKQYFKNFNPEGIQDVVVINNES